MTLTPERIGDKGQRFEVRYREEDDDRLHTLGWAATRKEADNLAQTWRLRPSVKTCFVVDREAVLNREAPPNQPGLRYAGWVKHLKRGSTYCNQGIAEVQSSRPIVEGDKLVIYQSETDQRRWARLVDEFEDGRFVGLPPKSEPDIREAMRLLRQVIKDGHKNSTDAIIARVARALVALGEGTVARPDTVEEA